MIIYDNILYLIIKKLDTKTLLEVDQIEELKFITTPIYQRRIKATKILQKFYRNQVKNYIADKKLYIYSFALIPEEHQPTGTLNLSRLY